MKKELDLIIVGGGLSSSLLAFRLARLRPELNLLILEKGKEFSERETWSFHTSDLTEMELEWVLPLATKTWPGYDVKFPGFERSLLGSHYHSIRAHDFHKKTKLNNHARFSAEAASVSDRGVYLRGGEFLSAKCVIDGRGIAKGLSSRSGYQKFVGIDLELSEPHGLTKPLLMDASVDQKDGYRFFYLLPWTDRTLLIEDTRYSSSPLYDVDAYRREIQSYAAAKNFKVLRELRVEHAALPIPLSSMSIENRSSPPTIGTKAGFFHHATGYSLPMAARVAERIARLPEISPAAVKACLENCRQEFARGNEFSGLLNRMLFCAAEPCQRRQIFSRFYRLPEGLVQRFYSNRLAKLDFARILIGKPPVSIRRAISAIANKDSKLC